MRKRVDIIYTVTLYTVTHDIAIDKLVSCLFVSLADGPTDTKTKRIEEALTLSALPSMALQWPYCTVEYSTVQ